MMVAVVFVKIKNPNYVTLAEVRAIDRLCQRFSDDMLKEIHSARAQNPPRAPATASDLTELHRCLGQCRDYLVRSRAKVNSRTGETPPEIPSCFGPRLSEVARKEKRARPHSGPSSSSPEMPATGAVDQ